MKKLAFTLLVLACTSVFADNNSTKVTTNIPENNAYSNSYSHSNSSSQSTSAALSGSIATGGNSTVTGGNVTGGNSSATGGNSSATGGSGGNSNATGGTGGNSVAVGGTGGNSSSVSTSAGGAGGTGGSSNSNATGGTGGAGGRSSSNATGGNSTSVGVGGNSNANTGASTSSSSNNINIGCTSDCGANQTDKEIAAGHDKALVDAANARIKNTPSMFSAPLVSSNDTCMGSTSGSVAAPGLGLSFGSTWVDENCKMLKNSQALWNMGFRAASLALMCNDEKIREALLVTGFSCPAKPVTRTEVRAYE